MKKLATALFFSPLVLVGQTNDLSVDSAFHRMGVGSYFANGLEYYKVQWGQLPATHFSAKVSNLGTNDLTNCRLKVEVKVSGVVVYEDSSVYIDLASGGYDSLVILEPYDGVAGFGDDGIPNVKFWIESDSTDDNNANDTILIAISNDFEMSRCSGNITSNFEFPPDIIEVGNVFEMFDNNLTICWANVFIADTVVNIGREVFSNLYVLDTPSGVWSLVKEGDGQTISAANLGEYLAIGGLFFNESDLSSGDIYMVTVGSYDLLPVLTTCQNTVPGSVLTINNIGEINPFTQSKIINLSFETFSAEPCWTEISENSDAPTFLNQNFPNPFHSITTIEFSLPQMADAVLKITDVSGVVMITKQWRDLESGKHHYQFIPENLAPGTYFYTLTAGDLSQTMRMAIIRN
jgi:hypothetical protein